MDIYEAIEKRYSVREYQDKPVEEAKLHRVLDAGRVAPSGSNRQEWKFVVVLDGETRRLVAEAADQDFLATAPVIIAVVGLNPNKVMHCTVPADPVDCAIAIDHMTLAAVAEGLGTCWIGHFDQDSCRSLLNVPSSAKIIELLALGYPAVEPGTKKRRPAEEIICYERFS